MTQPALSLPAADLAEALIACPSVTPATGMVFDCLADMLGPLGYTIHRAVSGEAPDGPVENLFAIRKGPAGRGSDGKRSAAGEGRRERSSLRRGRPERGGGDEAVEAAFVADADQAVPEPSESRAARPPRAPRERPEAAPRREERSAKPAARPRNAPRNSSDDNDSAVVGLGDHVPAFLMRAPR